jgi:hypothetical protein
MAQATSTSRIAAPPSDSTKRAGARLSTCGPSFPLPGVRGLRTLGGSRRKGLEDTSRTRERLLLTFRTAHQRACQAALVVALIEVLHEYDLVATDELLYNESQILNLENR